MTTAQDGGKVVSLTHRPPLPPGNTPGTHFRLRLGRPQGHSATGRITSLKSSNDAIGNRTGDLPVYSVVPYPTTPRRPPGGLTMSKQTREPSLETLVNSPLNHLMRLLDRKSFIELSRHESGVL